MLIWQEFDLDPNRYGVMASVEPLTDAGHEDGEDGRGVLSEL
jgi:hypothetical protein